MPSQTEDKNFYKNFNIKLDKFADFNTLLKFPKQCITSKMIQLSGDKDEFLITCLKNHPISLIKDHKIHLPLYEKNDDLISLKPIQNLYSCAEASEALIMSHGDRCLEFGRIKSFEGDSIISRFCQKIVDKPYTKLAFNTENRFIGFNESQIDFYDFKRITRLGYTTNRTKILDLDYCPKESSIIAFTTVEGQLSIFDIREGLKSSSKIHTNTNTLYRQNNYSKLIKWNPHVPYWIATATSEALEIFDIRYNSSSAPVLSIQHSNIHELCWSATNCDLILAASRDRRINLWSLGYAAEDCRLSMATNQFELGSLCASKQSAHMFYGLDDSDSLVNIKIRSDYLNSIAPHQSNDPDYQDIEEALYKMDLSTFKEKLSKISQETVETSSSSSSSSSSYDKLKELVLLTMPTESSSSSSSSSKSFIFDKNLISSIDLKTKNEKVSAFKLFLAQSTGINSRNLNNPLFMKQDGNSVEFQEFIDHLRLKIRIVELLNSNDFVTLKKFINLISEAFLQNLNFLDKFQSIKLFALIMKNDRGGGFEFLLRLCSAHTIGRAQVLQIWIWMSFYPTIFDSKSYELIKIRPAALSKSINDLNFENENDIVSEKEKDHVTFLEKIRYQFFTSLLENPEINNQNMKIINQLNLNIGNNPMILKKLYENEFKLQNNHKNEIVLNEIQKELFEEKGIICIISAEIIKNLLETTLKNSSTSTLFLVDFFQTAFRLQILSEKTQIGQGITEFITTTGFSRLKLLISQAASPNFRPSSHETILKAIEGIKRISSDPYSTLSGEQVNYLTNSTKLLQFKLK